MSLPIRDLGMQMIHDFKLKEDVSKEVHADIFYGPTIPERHDLISAFWRKGTVPVWKLQEGNLHQITPVIGTWLYRTKANNYIIHLQYPFFHLGQNKLTIIWKNGLTESNVISDTDYERYVSGRDRYLREEAQLRDQIGDDGIDVLNI